MYFKKACATENGLCLSEEAAWLRTYALG